MTIKSYKNYFKTKRIVNNKMIRFTFNTKVGCSIGLLIKQIARKLFKKDEETDVEGGGGVDSSLQCDGNKH